MNKKMLNLALAGTITLTGVGTGLSMGVGATSSAATSVTLPSSYGTSYNAEQLANIAKLSNEQRVALKKKVVESTKKYIGLPYIYGGNNPNVGLDCSSLMQWGYKGVGIKLPRVAEDQRRYTKAIPLSQAQPGDFIFWNGAQGAYHVAMIVDPVAKTFISEPAPGKTAHIGSYKYGWGANVSFGTIIPHADFNGKPAPVVTPKPTSTPTTTKSTPSPTTTKSTPKPSTTTSPVSKQIIGVDIADSYIDQNNPTTNYGNEKIIKINRTSDSKGNPTYINGEIKFNVKGLSNKTIKSIKLKVYANEASNEFFTVGRFENTWTETGLTYSNPAPLYTRSVIPGTDVTSLNKGWNEITMNVKSIENSDGDYSFGLLKATMGDYKTPISLASREDTSHAPQLIIETS